MADVLQEMNNQGAFIARELRPGLSRAEIFQICSTLPLTLPDDLVKLYETCDGIDEEMSEGTDFIDGLRLLPLSECVVQYQLLRGRSVRFGDTGFHPGWLPILHDGSGDRYMVDCDQGSSSFGVVVDNPNDGLAHPIFSSISDMLTTLLFFYREGVFNIDGGYIIDWDIEKEIRIGARLNPNLTYWTDALDNLTRRQQRGPNYPEY